MTIYGISGLGADERVFKHLELNQEIEPVRWIEPRIGESIKSYALRLSDQIKDEEFILIGVSFGGLMAVELNKILKPRLTILISSAETRNDLRRVYRLIGKIGIINLIPSFMINPPKIMMYWLFGARNRRLLGEILDDTDLGFAKWAMIQLTSWTQKDKIDGLIKIHGTHDKLIPYKKSGHTVTVKDGEHFMIVDEAIEISRIIKEKINNAG
jgi:pimeloyl-ACP methyl ester carboxylesterase